MVGSTSRMLRSFWLALIFATAASALAQERNPAAVGDRGYSTRAVQLLLPSRQLEPTSTFELRFPNEMVPANMVGKAATVSPLVFTPPMEGQFVWLSSRSGTFTPKGALPLGTKYQISLRAGFKDGAGRALAGRMRIRPKHRKRLRSAMPEIACCAAARIWRWSRTRLL